jgi:hypothetical protein
MFVMWIIVRVLVRVSKWKMTVGMRMLCHVCLSSNDKNLLSAACEPAVNSSIASRTKKKQPPFVTLAGGYPIRWFYVNFSQSSKRLLGRNLSGSYLHVVYRVLPDHGLRVFHCAVLFPVTDVVDLNVVRAGVVDHPVK